MPSAVKYSGLSRSRLNELLGQRRIKSICLKSRIRETFIQNLKMSDGKASGGVRCPDPSWKRLHAGYSLLKLVCSECFFSPVWVRSLPPLRTLQLTCESTTGAGLIMGIRICIAAVIGVAGTTVRPVALLLVRIFGANWSAEPKPPLFEWRCSRRWMRTSPTRLPSSRSVIQGRR